MEHHGAKIESIARSKGFDIKGVADKIGVTRVQVENDYKEEKLSRRRLQKYVPYFISDLDDFYEERKSQSLNNSEVEKAALDLNNLIHHKDDLLAAKDEIINEQRKHIETLSNMLRFFPNAVQQATITA